MEKTEQASEPHKLQPPFANGKALRQPWQLVFPSNIHPKRDEPVILPQLEIQRFISTDLLTPKLNGLYNYLWLAGLPIPCRPLHRQKIMNREVCLTERPDEHLVWHRTRLLLKPLPEYLLCHKFWLDNLCHNHEIYQNAVGFLLSYTWLIGYHSDFVLAKEAGLIPGTLKWKAWTNLIADFLHNVHSLDNIQVARRYHYGELRLSRLNSMTRYLPSLWSHGGMFDQHISVPTWYQEFFGRNFSWMLSVFVYMSVILSAMQVGLATPQLGDQVRFQNLSYGIALVAIAAVVGSIAIITILWVGLFCYHIASTLFFIKRVNGNRELHSQTKV
ncbi:hypothetical protein F5Y15DRAFT_388322 [Xylariaceae sp. FL0016]|nr:hypothetical protein F5Y15DRAFT_388322 [Xylariaceae sp. FL0016]